MPEFCAECACGLHTYWLLMQFVMALSNPLHGERRAGFVGKPLPGVQVCSLLLCLYAMQWEHYQLVCCVGFSVVLDIVNKGQEGCF